MMLAARWLTRRVGRANLLTLALLLLALGNLALSLATYVRSLDGWLLFRVTLPALLLGWWLGGTWLRGWAATLLALVSGLALTLVLVGRLRNPLFKLLEALSGPATDAWRAWLGLQDLAEAVGALLARISDWALALVAGEQAFDPIATAQFWSLALWAVSTWAGWTMRRRGQPFQALLPAGIVHGGILVYVVGDPLLLLPFLAATLALLPLVGHARREQRWEAAGIDFSLEVRQDVITSALPLLAVLLVTAAVAPGISATAISRLSRQIVGQGAGSRPVGQSFGLEPRPAPASGLGALRAPGLPRAHLIGAGPELSEQAVMRIDAGDSFTSPVEPRASQPPRYYWRSLAYDMYTGRGWHSGPTVSQAYSAGEPLSSANLPDHRYVRHEVQLLRDAGGLLYAAGTLVRVDQGVTAAWRSGGDLFAAQVEATRYIVESLVPEVSQSRLRAAGSGYPDWVRQRYLQLPDSIPARVRSLAQELTAAARTPYERAKAIEGYLRQFPYTLDVPAPPLDRDLVDYFLFDLRQGYCDYYATAMVVLARAAGLPSRLAVGYISGTYDSTDASYIISEAEAHSWAEVYFPGYGWIQFEPTAGRPPLPHDAPAETASRLGRAGPLEHLPLAPHQNRWWLLVVAGALLLGLGQAIAIALESWRIRRLPPAAALAVLYGQLYRHGQRLALPLRPGNTPEEFATMLAAHLTDLKARDLRAGKLARWLAPAADEARWLARLYVEAAYSRHTLKPTSQQQALATWRRLRWRLRLAQLTALRRS